MLCARPDGAETPVISPHLPSKQISAEPAQQHAVRRRIIRVVLEDGTLEILRRQANRWIGELLADRVAEERQALSERDPRIAEIEAMGLPIVAEAEAEPVTGSGEEGAVGVARGIGRQRLEGSRVE